MELSTKWLPKLTKKELAEVFDLDVQLDYQKWKRVKRGPKGSLFIRDVNKIGAWKTGEKYLESPRNGKRKEAEGDAGFEDFILNRPHYYRLFSKKHLAECCRRWKGCYGTLPKKWKHLA